MNTPKQYDHAELTSRQRVFWIIVAMSALVLLGIIFFKRLEIAVLLSAVGLWYPRIRRQQMIRKQKEDLKNQFQQALRLLASSLSAGRSVENAFVAALYDLKWLYPDPSSAIIQEFERIEQGLGNSEPIEQILQDFSSRAKIKDVSDFVDVFVVGKRTGGNLVEVIRTSAHMISDKMEVQREIAVMVAQKRFESRVLNLFPVGLIALLAYSSPEYMEPLYSNWGPFVMAAALAILILCYFWTQKIMAIEV